MADPRVALVTGAAGQIGTALLRRLAAEGFHTAGTDLAAEPPPPVADVVGLWLPGDVTELADMKHVVAEVLRRWSRLDVLVVNAGVTAIGTFADTSDEAFTRVMDVNFHGALRAARAALPALRESRGRIAVLSSVAGFAPVAGRPAYTASKHALTGLFESIRHELAADDVGLTMIYPSFLRTPPADLNGERSGSPGDRPGGRSSTGALLDADEVARRAAEAIRRGRSEVRVGRTARGASLMYRFAPSLYTRAMLRRLQLPSPDL